MRRDGGISTLRGISTASCAMLALGASLWFATQAQSQETSIIHPGSMAVTGFSGTVIPGIEEGLPPGVDPVDETFIDSGRATLRIFDVAALGGPPGGQFVYTPPPFEVLASQVGQIFALAYDDGVRSDGFAGVPNLYAGATSLHGLGIVTPDADADGRPERQRRGKAGASFMDGQFAESNGGSPGAIWKVDGASGAVSLFATIDGNSGPGIGDVSFDAASRQLFASDLDTGLLHRIGADGALIDTFDHGVAGRPAHSLAAVADDGTTMDIQSAEFDSEKPDSWGFTQDERRVWAVKAHGGRAYYSVGNKADIWSVGINHDGGFANDARWELTVEADQDYPVTDIAFDSRGLIYLARRGDVQNSYDYSHFADSGKGEVLRYWRESPDDAATESIWVEAPFPPEHRQAAGGLDLQYGYDDQGHFNFNACSDSLVKSGDRLRESDDPAIQEQFAAGGAFASHGVQITATSLVGPASEPPPGSWFVDFDGYFDDPDIGGHAGDVENWHPCKGDAGYHEQLPPPLEKKDDLTIIKRAAHAGCSLDGVCDWDIFIVNSGTETFNGPLTLVDSYPTGAPASSNFGPSAPWSCGPAGPGQYRCDIAGILLVPGASARFGVRTTISPDYPADKITSCTKVQPVPAEGDPTNNEACADQRVPHEHPGQPSLRITRTCDAAVAGAAVACRVTVINVGTAAPSGPVHINEAATVLGAGTPVQVQTVTTDGPGWNCGPVPADALSCRIPGDALTPGTSRHFDVTLAVSANDRFEGCAQGWFGPVAGDDIVHPIGKACDQGGADIHVEIGGDATCTAGRPCRFEITMANAGASAFSGRARIGDAMEVQGAGSLVNVAISEIAPPFGCDSEPATLPFDCEAMLTLAPGESRVYRVTVVIPDDGRFDNTDKGVAGQNCVAVIDPGAIPTRAGVQKPVGTPDSGPDLYGDASACHPFTIVKKPTEQCSEGFVLGAQGRCVCPEGTQLGADGCHTPPARKCTLLPGMIRTQKGECVCPKGSEVKNGACRKVEQPPTRQCKLPGQIRTQSGNCICPKRTELKNGACRTFEQPPARQCKLLPGQIRTKNGRCICPRGTKLANGQCRKTTIECPQGTRLKNGTCVPVVVVDPKGCPVGTVGKYPNCRKPQRLRPGFTIKPNRVDPGQILRRFNKPANPAVTRTRPTNPVTRTRPTNPVVTRPTRPTGPVIKQRIIQNRTTK